MKVLMLIPQLGYGGAEGAFTRLASHLATHADITIAVMAKDYGVSSGYTNVGMETGIPVIVLDGGKSFGGARLSKFIRWWRMIRTTRALKKNHDAAISFLSGANLLNTLSGFQNKTIVSERGSKRFDPGMNARQRWAWTRILDPMIYRNARWIVAASEGLAGEIIEHNRHVAQKTLAIEGTIDSQKLFDQAESSIEAEFGALSNYESVVAIGRLHQTKGFDFLIRVFSEVRKSRPRARLLLVGDGPNLECLTVLANKAHLRAGTRIDPERIDVIFAGYRHAPLRYLKVGRLFVMPSRCEGLPNALIEALATGVPVLAADCPWGPRSVLACSGDATLQTIVDVPVRLEHGVLMPAIDHPSSFERWINEITQALTDPLLRRNRDECAHAISRFDINATGPRWLGLIQDIAGDGNLHSESRDAERAR